MLNSRTHFKAPAFYQLDKSTGGMKDYAGANKVPGQYLDITVQCLNPKC